MSHKRHILHGILHARGFAGGGGEGGLGVGWGHKRRATQSRVSRGGGEGGLGVMSAAITCIARGGGGGVLGWGGVISAAPRNHVYRGGGGGSWGGVGS